MSRPHKQSGAAEQQPVPVRLLDATQQPGEVQQQKPGVNEALPDSQYPRADAVTAAVHHNFEPHTSGVKRDAAAAGLTQKPAQKPRGSSPPTAATNHAQHGSMCGGAEAAAFPADVQHAAAGVCCTSY